MAGQAIARIYDAGIWTTSLRDRRKALLWGKSRSFIADYAETAFGLVRLHAAPRD